MKKLSLRVEDLTVESFRTSDSAAVRGTVQGHLDDSSACSYGSPEYTACDLSCEFECGASGDCTPACPGGSGGCDGGTVGYPTDHPDSGCDLSCEFAC